MNPPPVVNSNKVKKIGNIDLYQRDLDRLDPLIMLGNGHLNDNVLEALVHALLNKHKIKKTFTFSNEIWYNVLNKFEYTKLPKSLSF